MTPDEQEGAHSEELSSVPAGAPLGATEAPVAGQAAEASHAAEASAAVEPGTAVETSTAVEPAEAEGAAAAGPRKSSRLRRALFVVLLVLSCLTVLVSSVSVWAHRTIFNTDQWIATVGPLAQNDAVLTSVSDHLTKQIDAAVKPEQAAKNFLPGPLDRLAGPISQGFDQIINTAVNNILRTKQFQTFWVAANRAVHERVVAVLKGQPTPHLTTANGDITLNLLPPVSKILTLVQSRAPGLLKNGKIPTITASTPVDQARAELSTALGRTLPENFGTPVLLHSSQLASAQHLVKVFNRLIIALIIVTIALIAATIWVAERRRRAIISLAIGIVVAMSLAVVLTKVITNQVVSSIAQPNDRGAVRATIHSVISGLNVISAILIAAGLVFAVVAFLSGPSRLAGSIRLHAGQIGRTLTGNHEGAVPPWLSWVAKYRLALSLGGLALALLVLIVVVEGWVGALITILVLAAYEGIITWFARSAGPGAGPGVATAASP